MIMDLPDQATDLLEDAGLQLVHHDGTITSQNIGQSNLLLSTINVTKGTLLGTEQARSNNLTAQDCQVRANGPPTEVRVITIQRDGKGNAQVDLGFTVQGILGLPAPLSTLHTQQYDPIQDACGPATTTTAVLGTGTITINIHTALPFPTLTAVPTKATLGPLTLSLLGHTPDSPLPVIITLPEV